MLRGVAFSRGQWQLCRVCSGKVTRSDLLSYITMAAGARRLEAGGRNLPLRPNSKAQSLVPQLGDSVCSRRTQCLLCATKVTHFFLVIAPTLLWVHLAITISH